MTPPTDFADLLVWLNAQGWGFKVSHCPGDLYKASVWRMDGLGGGGKVPGATPVEALHLALERARKSRKNRRGHLNRQLRAQEAAAL